MQPPSPPGKIRYGYLRKTNFNPAGFRPALFSTPRPWCVLLLLLLTTMIGGCGTSGRPQLQPLAPLPPHEICRVAVLPFINESNYAQADLIVYKILMSELVNGTTFRVTLEGDVRKAFRQMRIAPQQKPTFEQLRMLADRLGVQLLIAGTINEASEVSGGRAPNSQLVMTLQLIDAPSGRILWNTYHKKSGQQYQKVMHFGLVSSISGLARRMSQEILELWLQEGLKPCAD